MSKEPTQERMRELFEYHSQGRLICQSSRGGNFIGKVAGHHAKSSNRRLLCVDRRLSKEHRLIWIWHNGPIPSHLEVDHINRIPHDNRIENLRLLTHKQNLWNASVFKTNASGYSGVKLRRDTKKWSASIWRNGKELSLGCFIDKQDAIDARRAAELKYRQIPN